MPRPPRGPMPPGPPPRGGRPTEPMEIDLEELAKETETMQRLRFLKPEEAVFTKTPGGFVSLKAFGEEYARIGLYRAFPFTDPNRYISVREANMKAREIGIIENLDDFGSETAAMLTEQLDIRYFTPEILKINDIKDRYGFAYFNVVTDKGTCKFTIRNGGGSVVHLSETRLLISDLDGNRFEITDTAKLSPAELKKLDLFM